jgi:hypothetical protein
MSEVSFLKYSTSILLRLLTTKFLRGHPRSGPKVIVRDINEDSRSPNNPRAYLTRPPGQVGLNLTLLPHSYWSSTWVLIHFVFLASMLSFAAEGPSDHKQLGSSHFLLFQSPDKVGLTGHDINRGYLLISHYPRVTARWILYHTGLKVIVLTFWR